jgi:dCTP deaminase
MILSNLALHEALDAKRLIIEPEPHPRFPTAAQGCPYDSHSVDLRLGAELLVPEQGAYIFDVTLPNLTDFLGRISTKVTLEAARPYILEPNRFVLGITLERVALPIAVPMNLQTNTCVAARIEGKSSRARCGVLIHFTAPTVHPGWDGPLALEIINLGPAPFVLKLGMPIAQLIVEEVKGIPFQKLSQFQGQTSPGGATGSAGTP